MNYSAQERVEDIAKFFVGVEVHRMSKDHFLGALHEELDQRRMHQTSIEAGRLVEDGVARSVNTPVHVAEEGP